MKRFLFIAFGGVCVFGAVIVRTNNSRIYFSGSQHLPNVFLADTTPSKPDTTKLRLSDFAFNGRVSNDTTPDKPDTTKRKISDIVFRKQALSDSTPPKPDTPKLVAYIK